MADEAEVGAVVPASVRKFDAIQIDGIHPGNPITGEVITGCLQYFAVTKDQSGGTINPRDLTPRCHETDPIPLSRIRAINWLPLHLRRICRILSAIHE